MKADALFKTLVINVLDISGAARLLRMFYGGRGAIIALHSVQPSPAAVIDEGLVTRTEQLRAVLQYLLEDGFDFISMDELPERLRMGAKQFIAVTLDDGFRDNLLHAFPIFKEFRVPFTVYPVTSWVSRTRACRPALLRALLLKVDRIELRHPDGRRLAFPCATLLQKAAVPARIVQAGWHEDAIESSIAAACAEHDMSPSAIMDETFLSWQELGRLARDPLASVGVHTVSHASLGNLAEDRAAWEISASQDELRARLGSPIRHIAYPYGAGQACGEREFRTTREMGFLTGVTTHRGNLHSQHQFSLQSLPRHSLSMVRHSSNIRYLRVSLSGFWDSPINRTLVHR